MVDEFSPFRQYLKRIRERNKKKQVGEQTDITLEFLKNQWEKQKGICPYTGIKMTLPKTTREHEQKCGPFRASLDRIDSNRGYMKDNVEFVCVVANLAKRNFSKRQFADLIQMIKINNNQIEDYSI